MDNRGIRRRKEGQENDINIVNNADIFIRETSRNSSNNWNNNIRKYENENKNMHTNNSVRNITRKGMASDDSSNDGKKKSVSIFNSANISSISNNCMKSFNNILNNINYNITSATTFNINNSSNNNNNNNIYSNNYNRNHNMFNNNNNFLQNHSKNSFSKGFGIQNNANVYNQHYNNNINQRTDNYNYNYHNNNNNNINSSNVNQQYGSRNEPTLNSHDLEKFLNNNENVNKNHSNSSFSNNFCMNEINSLKNITNDDTYVTCLENLLRNHGNIDTNEMYKYNDKNINCLNDIIFLDVYRAYNVLTYMQEKVSVIIFTIKFIGQKLKRKHVPEEVVISLEFLNFCVKNLGLFFARFIDESFMKKISKLLRTTTLKKSLTKDVKSKLSKFLIVPIIHPGVATDPRLHFIKRKILFMMQLWHDSFILHQHICTAIFAEYKSLKEKGITFPVINKAEKFFVKNADMSPSFSDDNILHEIPLNLTQINNIMKSLKAIKNMTNGQEKVKCIQIVSKYKNDILQSINKLSDYKGNSNISLTLNSLLYINDQICIFQKDIQNENLENLQNKQHDNNNNNNNNNNNTPDKRLENSNDNHEDNHHDYNVNNNIKKKSKKKNKNNKDKDNTQMDNLNNIIFNKYDPWNVEQKNEKTNENDNINKLFFNNESEHFDQSKKNSSFKNLINNQNNDSLLFNNDIMFSFAENDLQNVKDISKKNENHILLDHIDSKKNNNNNNNSNNIMQDGENIENVDDKYSFFNELNDFDYNTYNISSSQNINNLELNNNNKDCSYGKDTLSDSLNHSMNNQTVSDISKEKEKLDYPISNQINIVNSSSLNIINNNMCDDPKELNNECINEKNNIYMETESLNFSNFKRQELHDFNNENPPFTTNQIKNHNLQLNNEDNDLLNDRNDKANLKLQKNNIILTNERNKSLYLDDNNNNNNNSNDTNRDNNLKVYDNFMIDNTSYIISTDTSSYKPKSSPDIKNCSIADNEQNDKNDKNHLNYTYKEEDVKEMNVYDHMSKKDYHDLFDTFGFNTNEEKDQKEDAHKNVPLENVISDNINKEDDHNVEYKISSESNDNNHSEYNAQKGDDNEHIYNNNNNIENNKSNNSKSDNHEDNNNKSVNHEDNNNKNNYDKMVNKGDAHILDPLDNNKMNEENENTPVEQILTNNEKIEDVKNNNTNNNISIQHNENEQKSDQDEDEDENEDEDSNDINFDEIDEITKAIDDLNDNFESMDMYKYDH
ncbi:hypothetical protein PFFCH_02918 [Plasmodium falciparum FCH/4]|uniref:VHS domain-containing protein n=1 Tax=Plasmodium falciparum FCH/4 TaxID=1036724 RepID=A0A024VMY2_PLAFA|nr:hypothetical protein PFFCH_02918 [Plasmodium falciparum FCH/4]